MEIKSSSSRRNQINEQSLDSLNGNVTEKLSGIYLNATSLDNKLNEFKVVIEHFKPKIIAVTETWFKNTSITNIDGYTLYRKDRSDGRRGGGVCLYIDNSIDSYELNDPGINICKLEQIWSVIYFGNDKYLIGCIYRPSDFTNTAEINVALSLAREYVDKKSFKDLLIMG